MSNDWAIKIDHLSKVYKIFDKPTDRVKEVLNPFGKRYSRDVQILKNINLYIKRGSVVGIIGKNGAGKSTILKIITGIVAPTSGYVDVKGKVSALLELGAGFNPEFTGIQNIYLQATLMGWDKNFVEMKMKDIIDFADIGEYIYQPVKNYSSGMFVRLAFAINSCVNPEILIVDEALSVGDIVFRNKCYRKIKELCNSGATILFVSHDMDSVRTFCTRAVWLQNGEIFRDGNPKKITRMYEDFMIHGKLPEESENDSDNIKDYHLNSEKKEYDNILWKTTKGRDSVGGEAAEILGVGVEREVNIEMLNGDENIKIYIKVKVNKKLNSPLFAIGLFNLKGQPAVHFNTYNSTTYKCEALEAQSCFVGCYSFSLPNLCNGEYFLDVGINETNDDNGVINTEIVHQISNIYRIKIHNKSKLWSQAGLVITKNAEFSIIGDN